MTNEERDEMIRQTHDRTIRLHEAVVEAKVPQRVATLEKIAEKHSVWVKILSSGVLVGIGLGLKHLFGGGGK